MCDMDSIHIREKDFFMKILFLNLPYDFNISRSSRWPEKTKSGTLYYPYWLCYSAGVCMERGFDVDLVDCITRKYTVEQTITLVEKIKPNYVMCEITTSTCEYDYNMLTKLKERCPDIKLIVGGTHATVLDEMVMNRCTAIDIIARQEFDYTVSEVMAAKDDLSSVDGITYRNGKEIIRTPDRKWIENMDNMPFVSKVYERFLNPNNYFYAFARKPMIQIFSARGCPFKCNFCSYPQSMSGHHFRKRSVKNFVDELEYISKSMPYIQEIFIEDDTFTIDVKRVIEICDEIIARDLDLVWSCNARANLSYDVMKRMKEAGCRLMVVGYESGNQNVLDETKKGIKLEDSVAFAENTKKLKIKVFGCFMIGLKGDNLKTIEETFKFAKHVYPDMVFFQQAVPFPGTEFYRWAKECGYLITEDYSEWLNESGYLRCLVDYPYADHVQIEKLRDKLMSRYYFSFTYIVKTFLRNITWQEFKRVIKAGTTYIAFRLMKVLVKKKRT